MKNIPVEKLAKDGGPKAVRHKIPYVMQGPNEIGEEERKNLLTVLRRKALFRFANKPEDSFVARFEKEFAKKIGVKHALAVSSGTASLVTGLTAIGVGPGDEVIIPAYTFIASAAAVILVRAIPVIAEIDETLTIDPIDLEKKITPHTRAIMPVHMRGIPCQMDEIMAIAKKHNLLVIEDVAQADGASYKGRRLGSIGDVGCFSLQHFKIITSGEGGVVITNNDRIYARAAMYHDSALCFWNAINTFGEEPIPGNGHRMSELAGAVVYAQLPKLDGMLRTMRQRKKEILRGIASIKELKPVKLPDPKGDAALSLNLIFPSSAKAKQFAEALSAEGVGVGTIHNKGIPDRHIYQYWDYVLNKTTLTKEGCPWTCSHYKGKVAYSVDMCPQTMDVLTRVVSVAINQRMTEVHSGDIVKAICKVAKAIVN